MQPRMRNTQQTWFRLAGFLLYSMLPAVAFSAPEPAADQETFASPEAAVEAQEKAERQEQAAAGDPSKVVKRPVRECKKSTPDSACCDHDFGVDPEAVAKACGYKSYLGEHRTFSTCQYHFDAGREKPGAITLALFEDTDFASAVDYHMSGFFGRAMCASPP